MREPSTDRSIHHAGRAPHIPAHHSGGVPPSRHRPARARGPSASGYMVAAAAAAAALFFVLWYMLQSEENPWVPAGLAASVVMLVAASARGVLMRRVWLRDAEAADSRVRDHDYRSGSGGASPSRLTSQSFHAAALRTLQKQSASADRPDSLPEAHLETYHLCKDYLEGADEALKSPGLTGEGRVALRAGQERVRVWQKHHLLTWARNASRGLTHEAQQRARLSEKIELGNRALDCIDTALKVYPEEAELHESVRAIREFMTSSKVAHWVELAERASFKGQYRRAIDCYSDALFYLTRDAAESEHRRAAMEQINNELESLRARREAMIEPPPGERSSTGKRINPRDRQAD